MPNLHIGVIRGASGRVYAVIKPDDDSELDKPCWTQIGTELGEALELRRVTREAYAGCRTRADLLALVDGTE
jgi:hypothetical protein